MDVTVAERPPEDARVEIVEHKGIGHPDTICDALAEELSVALSRHYVERFGRVLHHNVDKALLWGGAARASFGRGVVTAPMEIFLAGRATVDVGGVAIPVEEIAMESTRAWLSANLHALDADRHVLTHCLVRGGSADLGDLFERGARGDTPLANDTSCGCGYAPLSPLERGVLACADRLGARSRDPSTPHVGEDVKIMGVRNGDRYDLTIACAFVARHVPDLAAYVAAKDALARDVFVAARPFMDDAVTVAVNAADDLAHGKVYVTATGTSAEAGDDGQVGRGNRVNRLIAPGRPMTLEAAAGKNPISHVGKLYSVAAHALAEELVEAVPEIAHASVWLVSRIGRRIDDPAVVDLRLRPRRGALTPAVRGRAAEVARRHVAGIGGTWRRILAREITLY